MNTSEANWNASLPTPKIETLRALMASGDWPGAIRFAAKFPQLGSARDDILRAKDALNNPGFYRQLGRDPDALVSEGKAALCRSYSPRNPSGP